MDSETIGIRRAEPNDVDCLDLVTRHNTTGALGHSELASWLTRPGIFTYLAEDSAPFGFITVGGLQPWSVEFVDAALTGEVLGWALLPEYRRRGLGRKLLVHGLSVLKRRQFESAVIWTSNEATRAVKILDRLGFEPEGSERLVNEEQTTRRSLAYIKSLAEMF